MLPVYLDNLTWFQPRLMSVLVIVTVLYPSYNFEANYSAHACFFKNFNKPATHNTIKNFYYVNKYILINNALHKNSLSCFFKITFDQIKTILP